MKRLRAALPIVISVLALGTAAAALREARQPARTPSFAEIQADGIREFTAAGTKMTPREVRARLGAPNEVYRDNPNALCWRYDGPYEVRMCWGPQAATSLDRDERSSGRRELKVAA